MIILIYPTLSGFALTKSAHCCFLLLRTRVGFNCWRMSPSGSLSSKWQV